jgi:hypothetical protein
MQHRYGTSDDIFEGKFITKKDPEALSEFYQAEDLLKIIAVHPLFFNFVINKVLPDGEAPTEDTALLSLGETHFSMKFLGMEVSFEIIEREEETADGETTLAAFCRHERFIDWAPLLADVGIKILLWDQTWNFGFNRLEDGSYEVFHRCEKFHGPWPVRLVIFFHQRYVLWACERYINGDAFGTDDIDAQQDQMANIPLHVFQDFVGRLRAEKEKSLEAKRNDPRPDHTAIAKDTADLERLKTLAQRAESTIAVARRAESRSSASFAGRPNKGVKIVAADAETQEALQSMMTDARGNKAINGAMQELVKSPDLQFSERPERSTSRKMMRADTIGAPAVQKASS